MPSNQRMHTEFCSLWFHWFCVCVWKIITSFGAKCGSEWETQVNNSNISICTLTLFRVLRAYLILPFPLRQEGSAGINYMLYYWENGSSEASNLRKGLRLCPVAETVTMSSGQRCPLSRTTAANIWVLIPAHRCPVSCQTLVQGWQGERRNTRDGWLKWDVGGLWCSQAWVQILTLSLVLSGIWTINLSSFFFIRQTGK